LGVARDNSTREILYFDPIKEDRGSYFVEYQPPVSNSPIATLGLVYPESYDLGSVGDTMKAEVAHWLARYPVPIMAWAYDAAENSIQPNGNADDGLLVGVCAWHGDSHLCVESRRVAAVPKRHDQPSRLADHLQRRAVPH
jgi:hypothetical protein